MGSGKAQSAKKTKKKLPRSPKKKTTGDDVMETPSLNTDIAMELPEKEKAPTASSTSETSPAHAEDVPDTGPQVGITSAQETPQVFDKMSEPDMVAAKPVTFADLFKGNRDPDQGMILKQYDVGEGVLHIPDSIIKPVEELWGFCLVGCFTGRFPGLKAVDAIVKSWNVPFRIIPHCKGWVILMFENDIDRMDVLGRERDKAYGKELRVKIPSHGFMFDFAEFTTLPVWVQLHNVPLQLWSEEGIGMLASKVGKPLRTDLVTKQQRKGGFCRVLVEVDFSKQPVTHFEVACMGKTYTQLVVFEEDPKYCFHCKTWNHCPFYCKELGKKKEMAGLETTHKVDLDKPKETKRPPGKAGAKDSVPPGINPHVEPVGGLIPSSSNNKEKAIEPIPKTGGLAVDNMVGKDVDLLKKKRMEVGDMVGKRPEKKKGACLLETKITGAKLEIFVITKLPGWRFATNFEVLPGSRMVILWNPSFFACNVVGVGEQYLHCAVQCLTTQKEFVLSFIYGLYTVTKRRELWHDLSSLAQNITIPWALLGDFNCVLASNERVNCMSQGAYYMTDLQAFKSSNCLEDVPSTGNFFTWHKGNKLAKLDRVLANQSWGDIGLAPTCEFLDFNFLLAQNITIPWALLGDFNCVLASNERVNCMSQGAYYMTDLQAFKSSNCLEDVPSTGNFFTWHKGNKLAKLDRVLANQSWGDIGLAPTCEFLDFNFLSDHCPTLFQCGAPLGNRSRPFRFFNMWLKHENFNGLVSQFWEAGVVGSKQFSLCSKLKRLKPSLKSLNKQAFGHISRRAMEAKEEYGLVMKQKNRRKNTVGFLVREDGSKTTSKDEVASIFVDYFTTLFGTTSSVEPIELESLTAGTRVPSSAQSTLLASVTPEEVREAVFDIGAFVPGRSLVDNFLLAQHLIRDYAVKRSTPSCLIKLDITKAYDTVSWSFLQGVMHGLGFPPRFVSLIMECASSASSSIMVNGDSHGFFASQRGLRQGDPMAPTLFLFCIEYFSRLLNKRAKVGGFNYHKDCAALGITHLAFADDLMLFSRGDSHSVQEFLKVKVLKIWAIGDSFSRFEVSVTVHSMNCVNVFYHCWTFACCLISLILGQDNFEFVMLNDVAPSLCLALLHFGVCLLFEHEPATHCPGDVGPTVLGLDLL
ncbi:unnamed protein product [Cuscuta campestris]|uniref:Reverse transcriptase domain-containing protein n=1 Tax=Cuscuta campestris TaxID=132261 RepID=A0A484MJW9_9ASTE|nr:unnamed protein product [Cuscuta campestris]